MQAILGTGAGAIVLPASGAHCLARRRTDAPDLTRRIGDLLQQRTVIHACSSIVYSPFNLHGISAIIIHHKMGLIIGSFISNTFNFTYGISPKLKYSVRMHNMILIMIIVN